MSSARELLEQADALMRRNRRPPRDEDIPELTDAVGDEALPRAARPAVDAGRSALRTPATVDDIPELTEAVEEIEAPSIQEYPEDPDELSRWLREDEQRIAKGDRSPDSIVPLTQARREPGPAAHVDVAPLREDSTDLDTLIRDAAPVSVFAKTPAALSAPAVAPSAAVERSEEIIVFDEPAAAVEPAIAPSAEVERPEEIIVFDEPAAAVEPAIAPSAAVERPEEIIVFDEPAPAGLPAAAPAGDKIAEATFADDDLLATVRPDDATSKPPPADDDPERWKALAEEIRMQVLQRIDIFTDTGLREQLTARLQPVVDRASADLVATINREVGQLLRTYVAEAIEREIEHWRHGGG